MSHNATFIDFYYSQAPFMSYLFSVSLPLHFHSMFMSWLLAMHCPHFSIEVIFPIGYLLTYTQPITTMRLCPQTSMTRFSQPCVTMLYDNQLTRLAYWPYKPQLTSAVQWHLPPPFPLPASLMLAWKFSHFRKYLCGQLSAWVFITPSLC